MRRPRRNVDVRCGPEVGPAFEPRRERLRKSIGRFLERPVHAVIREPGDPEPRESAGVDPGEGLEVQGHVEGEAVVGAASPHAEAEGGDLRSVEVDAGSAPATLGPQPRLEQEVEHALLEEVHEVPHPEARAPEIDERVGHDLAGAVKGHLAPAVALHYRNVAGREKVFAAPRLPQREQRGVLDEPQLVFLLFTAVIGELAHRIEHRRVGLHAETAHAQHRARRGDPGRGLVRPHDPGRFPWPARLRPSFAGEGVETPRSAGAWTEGR